MKSSTWSRQTTRKGGGLLESVSQLFLLIVVLIALLVAILSDEVLRLFGPFASLLIISSVIGALTLVLRKDELTGVLMLAVHLNVDWYLGFRVISLLMALALICLCYLGRSPERPWVRPRYLWLWVSFLGLTIIPAIRGATGLYDALFYYPNLVVGALLMFWAGMIIGRSPESIRLFFRIFSFYCTLIAIHAIIQARTGVFLFGTAHFDTYIEQMVNNHLPGTPDVSRAGSFFVDTDWAGTFFAMALFVPLGLLVEDSSLLAKIFYLIEAVLISLALLFTYSTGSWLAAFVAAFVFLILLGRTRYRTQFLLCLFVGAAVILTGFSFHLNLLLQHSSDPIELSERFGAWETALRVIGAFPLTGVGLGEQAYLLNSAPYIVPAQMIPLAHPHNSYLEWGAMAGLPVLIVFVAILVFNMRWALHNWAISDARSRCLLAAGLAIIIVLSFNSMSVNAWTLPPLSAIGWLTIGTIASRFESTNQIAADDKGEREI